MSEDRRAGLDATAVALLVACCLIWGINQVATKVALADVPPLLQASLRSTGAALLLAAWSRARRLEIWTLRGTWRPGLLAGLLFAAEFACIFTGLQYTAASRMIVFIYLAPFVVALGMPLISRHERLSWTQAAGLALAFAGVVGAFSEGFSGSPHGDRQWLGDALGIVAAALWGGTTLVLRASRLSTAPPEQTLLYQLVVSAAALGAASVMAGESWPARVGALALGSMAFQTVVVTFGSYLVWFWLVRHYPATRIAAFTLLTPVFGLCAGVLLLGEPPTLRLLVATGTVVAGLALVSRPRPA